MKEENEKYIIKHYSHCRRTLEVRLIVSAYPPATCTPKQSSLAWRFINAHSEAWIE